MTSTTPPPAASTPGFPALPASVPPRRWTLSTTDGRSISGYLPGWATDDPSEHNIPPGQLEARLADVCHHRSFPGQTVRVYTATNHHGQPVEEEVLAGSIDCNPYASEADARVPVVNLHLAAESWLTDLDPGALTHLATQLRAQADRLDHEIRPALIAARQDWASLAKIAQAVNCPLVVLERKR